MKKITVGIIGIVFCTAIALVGCGHMAGAGRITTGGTLKYNHEIHSKLQGEERIKAAEQIIKVVNNDNINDYYPTLGSALIAPGGSLKKVGLVIFDANIMRSMGAKTPGCCANLYPLQGVQQILSERMLESWKTALEKHATSDISLVPLDKITQSASYQKEGEVVKDYPNNKETSFFQKVDKLLGFENIKYSFLAVPGGTAVQDTDWAVPRGLRMFKVFGAPGGAAYQGGAGGPIKEIGAENGLDAAIIVHSTFNWETIRAQMISNNLKGTATMSISASLIVPFGRWLEAVKASNQKAYGAANPQFRAYNISFEDKVKIPYDVAAQHKFASCCRDGIGKEAEQDLFAPMLAEYDQVVDMMVERMVADLRSTHKAPTK